MIEYQPKHWFSLVTSFRGSVLKQLAGRVLLVAIIGVVSSMLFDSQGFKVPAIAHTLIGAALGLLLVFRTNASYDRYWEGRRLLGALANRTRDVARQIAGAPDLSSDDRARVATLLVSFYRLGAQSLRDERDLPSALDGLPEEERRAIERANQRPYVVLTWLTRTLVGFRKREALDRETYLVLEQNLTALVDALGGCERIKRTPVPFAYAQHIKIFVLVFCFTSPFAMVESMRWYTPLAAGLLAFALFGIDEIGVEIEDPFGHDPNDLPVDAIGDNLERTIRELSTLDG